MMELPVNRFSRLVFNWPRTWLLLIALASLGLGAGVLRLRIDNSVEALLQAESPTLQAFRIFTQEFGNAELTVVAFRDDAGIMRPGPLERIGAITQALETEVRHVDSVISLANVQVFSSATSGELQVVPLLADGPASTEAALADARQRAGQEPYIDKTLLSPDGRTTGIVVRSVYPEDEEGRKSFRSELTRDVYTVLDRFGGRDQYYVGGPPVFMTWFDQYILQDLLTFGPLVMVALSVLLAMVFRSLAAVILPLAMVGLAGIWTIGFMGWMGFPITLATTIIPPCWP